MTTITTTAEVNLEVEAEVICSKCGGNLESTINSRTNAISVEPCVSCFFGFVAEYNQKTCDFKEVATVHKNIKETT